jgi:hypothetical protein
MTQTTTLTDWLAENGFGFGPHPSDEALIILTGEWISEHQEDVFEATATIEPTDTPNVYRVMDSQGPYRLEVYAGGGTNGVIADWL